MFGIGRISGSFSEVPRERRTRALAVGATIGFVVLAASAGYTVRSGDTLSEIAKDQGTSVAALVAANEISNADLIRIGQVLTIPGSSGTSSKRHTVGRGETLGEIAARYGVSVTALVKANDLANANLIRIGQRLTIPAKGGTEQGGGGSATVTHVVKSGETLSQIAARYGTTVAALVKQNDIARPSLIVVGTKLTITGSGGSSSGGGGGSSEVQATHKVVSGETLGEIAARYGVSANAIASLNNLSNPNRIRIGQKLRIPARTAGATTSTGFACPVPSSRFVNDYAYIKPNGRFHQGIDMFAPMGTPVYAPVSGRVDAINGTLGGLQFWLYGDDGNVYIGTHMRGFGQVGRVPQGAVIGSVGDTGNAIGSSPHLHFEILVDGEAVNPYPKLRSACG